MIHRRIAIHDVSPLGNDEIGEFDFDSENMPRIGDVIGITDARPERFYEVIRYVWFTNATASELANNHIRGVRLISMEVLRFDEIKNENRS